MEVSEAVGGLRARGSKGPVVAMEMISNVEIRIMFLTNILLLLYEAGLLHSVEQICIEWTDR